MHKIIYSSPTKIDWDAQSAFKITNYYTEKEECMVFCYLKQYVSEGNLKLCTYCFDSQAKGKKDLQLCIGLNPLTYNSFLHMEFGIDGISSLGLINPDDKNIVSLDPGILQYHTFKTNDQQGFYWCGEITIPADFTKEHFSTCLEEKSIILLNFYKVFADCSDYASLFPDNTDNIFDKHSTMEEFIVLNY